MTTETTTATATAKIPAPATPYQEDIARYWNNEARPVNLRLGDVDGLYHHHYGIGPVDRAALGDPEHSEYEKKVIAELHRLESAQAEFLMDHLARPVPTTPSSTPAADAAVPWSWPTAGSAAGSRE